MKRSLYGCICCLLIFVPIVGRSQGAATTQLPAAVARLAPAGVKVSSGTFGKTAAFADASFVAEKKLSGNHAVYYNFHLLCHDTSSPLWKMRGPIYQEDTRKKIDAKRASLNSATSNPSITYDAVKETKYPWGSGFTQRVAHHYVGAGSGSDYIDYRTAYVGMVGGLIFELSADGTPTADEADQWAKSVADKATTISIGNIGS